MKKLFTIVSAITAMAIAAPVINAQAHNSARKIANAVRGANGPCTTPDGRQGTQYPSGSTVTTTTTRSNGYTNNSGSTSTSTSVSGNVGTSGIGASGSYGNTRTSPSTSTNSGTTTTTTTSTTYICVPNK